MTRGSHGMGRRSLPESGFGRRESGAEQEESASATVSLVAPFRGLRRASQSATSPAVADAAAPIRRAPLNPKSSMKTSPASSVPTTAPTVFAEYRRPKASPTASDL